MSDEEAISVVGSLLLVLVCGAALFLLVDKRALRDNAVGVERRPYSLARVLLWWWTVVILGCWLTLWEYRYQLWDFGATCLAAFGISFATLLIARIIDQEHDTTLRVSKRNAESKGFLRDILSDEHGLAVHRFQCAAINLALSFTFAVETLKHASKEFHEFDPQTLALLGISAGGYLAVKKWEGSVAQAPLKESVATRQVPTEVPQDRAE